MAAALVQEAAAALAQEIASSQELEPTAALTQDRCSTGSEGSSGSGDHYSTVVSVGQTTDGEPGVDVSWTANWEPSVGQVSDRGSGADLEVIKPGTGEAWAGTLGCRTSGTLGSKTSGSLGSRTSGTLGNS